jgi:hypothetical protein
MNGEDIRRSAVALLKAVGILYSTDKRSSALISGSCGGAQVSPRKRSKIDVTFGDVYPNLLVTSKRAAYELGNRELGGIGDHFPGGTCGKSVVLAQRTLVIFHPG